MCCENCGLYSDRYLQRVIIEGLITKTICIFCLVRWGLLDQKIFKGND